MQSITNNDFSKLADKIKYEGTEKNSILAAQKFEKTFYRNGGS